MIDWLHYEWYGAETDSYGDELGLRSKTVSLLRRNLCHFDELVNDEAGDKDTCQCLPDETVKGRDAELSCNLIPIRPVLLHSLVLRVSKHVGESNTVGGHNAFGEDIPEGLSDFIRVAKETDGGVTPDVNCFFLHH